MTSEYQPPAPARACAHRGDSSRYRENTLPAIRSAIAEGAHFVEIDVRVSADGAVIVLHDPTAERLWGLAGDVAGHTWDELRMLGDGETRIPLLSEVLELFVDSDSTLLIDMEEADPAASAYRVVAGSGAKVAWCGHLDGMTTIRSLDPAASIWMPWAGIASPSPAEIEALAPDYVNAEFLTMTRAMVEDIHALGCKVAVWTVDDVATMRWARGIGVDSVTTNQLKRLQQVISEEPAGGQRSAAAPGEVDLDAVLAIAHELGQWAIDFAASSDPGQISTKKNPADLVTEVDVAVERHVREVVGDAFPGFGFVGEEMGGAAAPGVPCWYLDPVDGTTNFANRIPWNAFSLALVIDDTPLVGVVADPWRGELFEAVRGRGATLNGVALCLAPADEVIGDPLSGRVVSTELASYEPWPGMLDMLDALSKRYCTMRIMGSGTMTMVGIAAGRGVGSVIGSFGPVDHLAAVLIVAEAGGVVLDSSGRENLFPSSGGILAAAPHAADALNDLWQAACAAHG